MEKITSIAASVRLHRQAFEQVRDWAVKESRTTSNMIAILVKEALKARGPVEPEAELDEVEP